MPTHSTKLVSQDGAFETFLDFQRINLPTTQARHQGRHFLRAKINLKDYRCKAVIDKIDFEFACAAPTQRRYVQEEILKLFPRRNGKQHWVEVLSGSEASAAKFKVTLQDPDAAKLVELEEMLCNRFQKVGRSCVTEFEVSVDFYPKDQSEESRARIVAVLQRHFLAKFDAFKNHLSHPRFVIDDPNDYAKGKSVYLMPWHEAYQSGSINVNGDADAWLTPEKSSQPFIDKIVYIGAGKDDVMIRIQNKTTNNRRGEVSESLSQNEKRARVEVRLRGNVLSTLGIYALDDVTVFDLGRLQSHYFHFALPSFASGGRFPGHWAVCEYVNRREEEFFRKVGLAGMQQVALARIASRRKPAILGDRQSALGRLSKHFKDHGISRARVRRGGGVHERTAAFEELNSMVREALRNATRKTRRRKR